MIVTRKKALSRRTVTARLGVSRKLCLLDSGACLCGSAVAHPPVQRGPYPMAEIRPMDACGRRGRFEVRQRSSRSRRICDRLLVVSGPEHGPERRHDIALRASTRWLTGVPPKEGQTASVLAGVSCDGSDRGGDRP